ncbi:hypothetical protein L9F63_017615, partial [Diploptera punctata]
NVLDPPYVLEFGRKFVCCTPNTRLILSVVPCTYGKKAVPKVCSFFSDVLGAFPARLNTLFTAYDLGLLITTTSRNDYKSIINITGERGDPIGAPSSLTDVAGNVQHSSLEGRRFLCKVYQESSSSLFSP